MASKLRSLITGTLLLVGGWTTWTGYNYFFDMTRPTLMLDGMRNGGHYRGDVSCTIVGQDNYKIATTSVWIDGQPLVTDCKINAKACEHPFVVPTQTLADGEHTLKIALTDGTYHANKMAHECSFVVDNKPLKAALVKSENDFKVYQGRTLHVQFQANKLIKSGKVNIFANSYDCFPESQNSTTYECYVPVPCEENPNDYLLSVDVTDEVGNVVSLDSKLQVMPFNFKRQIIRVAKEKLVEEKEASDLRAKDLESSLALLAQASPKEKMWHGPFYTPIDIKAVATDFGTIRTTQEKGRYMHKALDILNDPKSVVWSSHDGVVVIKDRYEDSGNTVVVDHGHGVLSMYYHLDEFADLAVGDNVKRGNRLGTLGKTGYATGYHLHWELRVNNVPVDPMQWVKSTF